MMDRVRTFCLETDHQRPQYTVVLYVQLSRHFPYSNVKLVNERQK